MNTFYTNTNRFSNIRRRLQDGFLLRKTLFVSSGVLTILALVFSNGSAIYADEVVNTAFEVNVQESLEVSITAPTTWATGDANQFLRNTINVEVSTNNANGFRASMYSQNTTNLVNMSQNTETIPTLSSNRYRSDFPASYWGYSLNDGGNNGLYHPMVSTSANPITIIDASAGTTYESQDVYFGAKANMSKSAGTYTNTVIISVVTGVIDNNNPATPTNPSNPNNTPNVATYNNSNNTTVYTYRNSSSGNTTTTTQVSDGNNVSAYNGYTPPQGARESVSTTESINEGASLAAGLATTAVIAAGTGMFFFALAARREDDEEEDEEQQMI